MAGLTGRRRPQACRVWTVAVRNRDDQERCEAYIERRRQQVEDAISAFEAWAAQITDAEKEDPPCL